MPLHSYIGLGMLAASEAGMFARIEPFWSWHTPIAWTGYILLLDGIIYSKRGSSWLMTNRREFCFLAVSSIPLWLIFEGYNLLIENWRYVNLPANPIARYAGFAWAFATVWPGIFETAELVAVLRGRGAPRTSNDPRRSTVNARPSSLGRVLIIAGGAMLTWPIVWPSPYLAAPVFLGFLFLLDPLNHGLGAESLLGDLRNGRTDRLVNLLVGGFICGVLWEFWNYWARTKWIYTVPVLPDLKIFEMPVLGYFGFPPFALECFTMYVFLRRLVWPGPVRPIGV
jgi:hypothetical protein